MPALAVHVRPLVPVDGVVADQHDGTIGNHVVEQEPHQGAAQSGTGPGRAGQDAPVVGRVPGGEMPEGAQQVGDGAPTGREDGPDQQCRGPLVGGAGEMQGQNLHQGVGLGW